MEFHVPDEVIQRSEVPRQTDEFEGRAGFAVEPLETIFPPSSSSALDHTLSRPAGAGELYGGKTDEAHAGVLSGVGFDHYPEVAKLTERQARRESYDLEREDKAYVQARTLARGAQFMQEVGHVHNNAGIDDARIRHFCNALGIRPHGESVVVDDKDIPTVVAAAAARALKLDAGNNGFYFPSYNMTIVFRHGRPDHEVERTKVHEWAGHSSGSYVRVGADTLFNQHREAYKGIVPKRPRVGFKDIDPVTGVTLGAVLEESFAHWVSAEYTRAAGMVPLSLTRTGRPAKYSFTPHQYDVGAVMLDALFSIRPESIDAMLAARTDPAAMEEFMGAIDDLRPGLFADLSRLPGTLFNSYQARSDVVRDFLGLCGHGWRDDEVSEFVDHGPGAEYMRRKLMAYHQQHGGPEWYPQT